MAREYRILSGNDFIKAKPSGEFDLEQSKRLFAELVAELGRHRSAFRNKIAVLARDDKQFNNVRFMQLCGTNRGFQIKAFVDFESTIGWLMSEAKIEIE